MNNTRTTIALSLLLVAAGCAEQTGLGLSLVSEQETQQLGQEAWQDIRAQTPAATSQAQQQRAQRVAERILAASGESPSAWEIVVFQGQEANAFALPARKIGVFEGMMKLADTDAQLAAVLSHEVAHVERKHSAERLSTAMATQAGGALAGAALGAAGVGSPQMVETVLGVGAQYGLLLPYSRNQELEADRVGLRMMARAGFDPREAVTLWQKMEQGGAQPPAFLSTHPAAGKRIEQLQAAMPQALAEYQGKG